MERNALPHAGKMRSGNLYIGTSGWHYPHWVGTFYPTGMASEEFLPYYARHFSTVEINSTFYHLPTSDTLTHWRNQTPRNFLFTCKGSRYLTHIKKLKDPQDGIHRFFEAATKLHSKLGPILFQLPPRWKKNIPRLEAFLNALPGEFRYAFEFRDARWFDKEVYQLLEAHQGGFCLYHLAGQWAPEIVTANFVYIRLHGPGAAYQGTYNQSMLRAWAHKCRNWHSAGKDVYCYFDNDEQGYAPLNALTLLQYLHTG